MDIIDGTGGVASPVGERLLCLSILLKPALLWGRQKLIQY